MFATRIYTAIALLVAAVLSDLSLSTIPLLLFFFYLYLWWRPLNATAGLLANYFLFFALTILFQPVTGTFFPLLISLPVLVLVNHSLLCVAQSRQRAEQKRRRAPGRVFMALSLTSLVILIISLLLGSHALALTSLLSALYLGITMRKALRGMPSKPVEEIRVQQRMVAGAKETIGLRLMNKSRVGGKLFLQSPYAWLKPGPDTLSLDREELSFQISLSPPLAGPAQITLTCYATDRWGFSQSRFEINPLSLYIIPRAKYARWLAQRYLAATRPGLLSPAELTLARKVSSATRSGTEYHASRPYQPGDNLKNIDWKHSIKLNELVTRDFKSSHGQSAVMWVNLAAADAEDADKLSYKLITTAICLARENIPTALAGYDHEAVRLVTPQLPPQKLVFSALRLSLQIVAFTNPRRYLNPPDIARLRADISRIRNIHGQAPEALLRLLGIEYKTLGETAYSNPAAQALTEALSQGERKVTIVVVSQRNHDAEALAFLSFSFDKKGYAIIKA